MSANLQDSLHQWRERFDALQPRERHIILILLLVIVAFLWDLLYFSPLQKEIANTERQIGNVAEQIVGLNNEVAAMAKAGKESPLNQLHNEKKHLGQAIDALDRTIDQLTGNLIPAKKMVQVLEDVLQQTGRLQLVAVKSLPVRPLVATDDLQAVDNKGNDSALYLHSVELTLRGSYFDAMTYLQALEQLPWQVIWEQLEYQVESYPQADIKLRINTLSSSAGLLGV